VGVRWGSGICWLLIGAIEPAARYKGYYSRFDKGTRAPGSQQGHHQADQ
jgi:hypothetical protein